MQLITEVHTRRLFDARAMNSLWCGDQDKAGSLHPQCAAQISSLRHESLNGCPGRDMGPAWFPARCAYILHSHNQQGLRPCSTLREVLSERGSPITVARPTQSPIADADVIHGKVNEAVARPVQACSPRRGEPGKHFSTTLAES